MRGLIVLIAVFVLLVGGGIILSRRVVEQPTKIIEAPVTATSAPAQ